MLNGIVEHAFPTRNAKHASLWNTFIGISGSRRFCSIIWDNINETCYNFYLEIFQITWNCEDCEEYNSSEVTRVIRALHSFNYQNSFDNAWICTNFVSIEWQYQYRNYKANILYKFKWQPVKLQVYLDYFIQNRWCKKQAASRAAISFVSLLRFIDTSFGKRICVCFPLFFLFYIILFLVHFLKMKDIPRNRFSFEMRPKTS